MIFCVVKSGVTKAPGKTVEYRSFKNYSKADHFVNDLKDVDWESVAKKEGVDSAVSLQEAYYNKHHVNKEMQKRKAEYYSNLISENKRSNPCALWKTLNDITSRKQSSQTFGEEY